MRRKVLCGMMLAMGLVMAFGQSNDADAKSKKAKVSYTVKKGTLTIKGKGAMKSSMKFSKIKKAKNVKKIVVKKGITAINIDAFRDLKKVKTITVANSVKKIGRAAFKNCKNLQTITIPGNFEVTGKDAEAIDKFTIENKVVFNSKYNPEVASWINSENLVVMKNDPKYTSVDGVVYTKDKKNLVTVPAIREKLAIIDGCKTFDLNAIRYKNRNNAGGCSNLTSVAIPASLESIVKSDVEDYNDNVKNFTFKSKTVSGKLLASLMNEFNHFNLEKAMKLLPDQIVNDNGMIYSKDGVLYDIPHGQLEVVVPNGIKVIALQNQDSISVTKLTLPQGLVEIANYGLQGCYDLKEIAIPSTVTSIGERALVYGNYDEVVIPATVKYVGSNVAYCDIRVMGSASGFAPDFANASNGVTYEKGMTEAKAAVNLWVYSSTIEMSWTKIYGVTAYEVQLSFDKNFKKPFYSKDVNQTFLNISKKAGSKTVYARVRPYKKANGKMNYGKWCVVSK